MVTSKYLTEIKSHNKPNTSTLVSDNRCVNFYFPRRPEKGHSSSKFLNELIVGNEAKTSDGSAGKKAPDKINVFAHAFGGLKKPVSRSTLKLSDGTITGYRYYTETRPQAKYVSRNHTSDSPRIPRETAKGDTKNAPDKKTLLEQIKKRYKQHNLDNNGGNPRCLPTNPWSDAGVPSIGWERIAKMAADGKKRNINTGSDMRFLKQEPTYGLLKQVGIQHSSSFHSANSNTQERIPDETLILRNGVKLLITHRNSAWA